MRATLLLLLSLHLYATPPVVPIEYIYSQEYRSCIGDSMSSLDALSCMGKEIKVQEKILNNSYSEALKSLQKFRRKDLKKMQKLWRMYVDAKCNFYYHKESVVGGISDVSSCKLEEITKRAIELDRIY